MPAEVRRRRNELVLQVQRVDDAVAVFAAASARLRRLVPFDAAVWLTTDPATGLPTAPTMADNLKLDGGIEQCSDLWRREFLVPDVNLYRDIARAEVPAASLRATVDDPEESARFREFLDPLGFADELRAVLRVGDSPWGSIDLLRRRGRAPFSHRETELVASLSAPLGEALRNRARPAEPLDGPVPRDQPGLLLFDRDGTLLSANEEARAWLAELPHDQDLPSDLEVGVPMWLLARCSRPSRPSPPAATAPPARGSGPGAGSGWSAMPPACVTATARSGASPWSSSRPRRPRWPRSSSRPTT